MSNSNNNNSNNSNNNNNNNNGNGNNNSNNNSSIGETKRSPASDAARQYLTKEIVSKINFRLVIVVVMIISILLVDGSS